MFHRPIVRVGANKSNNWSGYNQGTLEKGGTQFSSVDGTWTVPTARQHKAGEAEFSASWVGIGGGCVDASCSVTDATLIQPGLWSIDVQNQTTGQTFNQTTPYTSTHATAEWIEETPVVIDNSGTVTVGPLPALSTVGFDQSQTNGKPAGLVASEQMQLIDANGAPLATPSAPDPDADGFNVCSFALSCGAPSSS